MFHAKPNEQPRPAGLSLCWDEESRPLACRNILIIEYRDEVFARLAADLSEAGLQIERATCATGISRKCASFSADLLVVNVDLPDGSGWLLTAKLRLVPPAPRIWLYAPWPSPNDMAMTEFVGADDLIAYGGDLYRLSTEIVSRVSLFIGDVRCQVNYSNSSQSVFLIDMTPFE